MKRILLSALAAACLVLSGCQIKAYNAREIHRTMSYPLVFTDTVHAVGISKETGPDGAVKRKAETLTHEITVGGFTRAVTYKDAEIESEK